jgi:hypothetical protein
MLLKPKTEGSQAAAALKYPLKLDGRLEWDEGAFKIAATLN